MAYGITHESQLIDIYTIMDGVNIIVLQLNTLIYAVRK